ncbi:hypothetical protein STHAL_18350 [Streptomyces halstedii]|uniref:Uncharacterized protein n=1 Tax=Streptomyces halstedii TaxID=1944 RepID=A0ABS6TT08_STRHA|nr:hypothetical protein [Streptomyces halstedii]MBV7671413.1 hypothetical protein [Streptomyces halstedii]
MNAPMTPDREQEIRALVSAATPGPWLREDDQRRLERFVTNESGTLDISFGYLGNNNQANTEFVANARSAVPELLAEVDRLRGEVSNLSDDVTGACLARYEEEQDADRLRLALASAQRGRRELRARVAELEAQAEKVAAFCAQRAEYVSSLRNCHPNNAHDYNRWTGHAEARRQLSQSLGLPVAWPAKDNVHPLHPAPCRHPASPDCTCPDPGAAS